MFWGYLTLDKWLCFALIVCTENELYLLYNIPWWLNEIIFIKYMTQCQALHKFSVRGSNYNNYARVSLLFFCSPPGHFLHRHMPSCFQHVVFTGHFININEKSKKLSVVTLCLWSPCYVPGTVLSVLTYAFLTVAYEVSKTVFPILKKRK